MDPIAILTGLVSALGGLLGLFGGLCACIVPVVLLIGFGIFMYRRNQQGQAAKQAAQAWPGTMGTVLSSSVESRRTGNSMSTYPVVVYQYQVNGQVYQGQTIKAGEQFFNVRVIGDAQATAARYQVGAQVMVYYNPANPQESALER
ncbi:MAG: DUF3592 domain-containing protein [Chloroflexota bacterium]